MSRHLSSRPNLDHLRKQAKDLLGDIRKGKPDWTREEPKRTGGV